MTVPRPDARDLTARRDALQRDGAQLADARHAVDLATMQLRGAVLSANLDGIPEAEIARLAGVDRMTIRKWLGK